ncbi:MAG: biopolymer transporter ExbD [Planctomycetaceae bacterium]|nr:biopolymer transporter ExbD [Planctomycetaceae bacterium]
MILRHRSSLQKIEMQMAPMIDVVFQLLIFFMLTLKILSPEGDFNVNMPIGQARADEDTELRDVIPVRLSANPDGTLKDVALGSRSLGNDERVFDRLNNDMVGLVGRGAGGFSDEVEVEIDFDYGLRYNYVIQALSACTGRINPQTKEVVTLVDKVKFAKPRPRPESAE